MTLPHPAGTVAHISRALSLLVLWSTFSLQAASQDCAPPLDLPVSQELDASGELTLTVPATYTKVFWRRENSASWLTGNAITLRSPGRYTVHAAVEGCADSTVCWLGGPYDMPSISLPENRLFTDLEYAFYGTPSGTCESIQSAGNCAGFEVTDEIYNHIVGRNFVDGIYPGFIDLCVGTQQYINFRAVASPCAVATIDVLPHGASASTIEMTGSTASVNLGFSSEDDILAHSFTMTFQGGFDHDMPPLTPGQLYRAHLTGTWYTGGGSGHLKDGCFGDLNTTPVPYVGYHWNGVYTGYRETYIRPYPDAYNPNHEYDIPFIGGADNHVGWKYCCLGDDSGSLSWTIYAVNDHDIEVSWSNGATGLSAEVDPADAADLTATVTVEGASYTLQLGSPGCTDANYAEYDSLATFDDGSCLTLLLGCTNPLACNYVSTAETDDGSCDFSCCPGPGCCHNGTHWDLGLEQCVITSPTDVDMDGCTGAGDVLDILANFGYCVTPTIPGPCGGLDFITYHSIDYDIVEIGDECWFIDNLQTELYTNGDSIHHGFNSADWALDTASCCVYAAGDSPCNENCNPAFMLFNRGRLYNGQAVLDPRGLCPSGWHVSTDEDWFSMELLAGVPEEELGNTGGRGGNAALAIRDVSGWASCCNGTNELGFAGQPGGRRNPDGSFEQAGGFAEWWTGTPVLDGLWGRLTHWYSTAIVRDAPDLAIGRSIRCVKN